MAARKKKIEHVEGEIQAPAKIGRPRIDIKKDVFESLCSIMCTEEEIAMFFKCTVDTINNWCKRTYKNFDGKPMTFSEVYKRYSSVGRISLRRQLFKQAEAGNTTMQIFLAKTILGMREEYTLNFEDDGVDLQIYIPDNGR